MPSGALRMIIIIIINNNNNNNNKNNNLIAAWRRSICTRMFRHLSGLDLAYHLERKTGEGAWGGERGRGPLIRLFCVSALQRD